MTEDTTLFDRIGGESAVEALVSDFYRRVLADPELAPYFADTPMEKLRAMQREFFAAALDGPIRYEGRPLSEVHAGRGIQTRHLARFLDHLVATIADRGLDERDRYEMFDRIHRYADEITGGTAVDG